MCSTNENKSANTKKTINEATGNATLKPINKSASPNPNTSFNTVLSLYFAYKYNTNSMIITIHILISDVLQKTSNIVFVRHKHAVQSVTIGNRNQYTLRSFIS